MSVARLRLIAERAVSAKPDLVFLTGDFLTMESQSDPRLLGAALATVLFQDGPVAEVGVNGCHNEDLIAIVIDRLQHFQRGDFACRENALALT